MDSSAMDSTLVSALNYAEGEMKKAEDEGIREINPNWMLQL